MTRKPAPWTIYDPRLGRERRFELSGGKIISNVVHNVWVMEGPPREWQSHADRMDLAFAAIPGIKFATCLAWPVGNAALYRHALEPLCESIDCIDAALLILRARSDTPFPSSVLKIRESFGGGDSGLWSVGVVEDYGPLADSFAHEDSPILGVAASVESVWCALCLDELIDLALVKVAPVAESVLRAFEGIATEARS